MPSNYKISTSKLFDGHTRGSFLALKSKPNMRMLFQSSKPNPSLDVKKRIGQFQDLNRYLLLILRHICIARITLHIRIQLADPRWNLFVPHLNPSISRSMLQICRCCNELSNYSRCCRDKQKTAGIRKHIERKDTRSDLTKLCANWRKQGSRLLIYFLNARWSILHHRLCWRCGAVPSWSASYVGKYNCAAQHKEWGHDGS